MTVARHMPTDRNTVAALRIVGRILGAGAAWQRDGRFYFDLGGGWLLSVSPDSAGRFRLGACYGQTEVATMWTFAEDRHRLADLVRGLRHEIASLASTKG